ncbi:hypothetical protein C8J55DRAFT_486562 [Lentinula edodes]|uniref:DUF6533 domain-containing protein n=1 Tax=Lentinula lateritia TaxID=40482 RepID=A0A9W9ARP9_9AGAR|nr:hypothetical protein C8J55DRAFT_486562 [Lentinula edodes]
MDDILPQIESWLLSNYAQAAVITLCVADHIETWPREFSSIWKTRKTGISVLFLVNRYMLLLSVMIQAISAFPGNGTEEHCSQCRNNVIFGMASAFIISRFALDIWSKVLEVGASTIDSPFQNLLRLKLGIPLLALGYDTFIFVLTAMKTVQHSLEMQRLKHSSITQIIIRDESLKVSLKSGNLINFEGFVAPFFEILPNILISRLMLNLRTYSEPGNTSISQGQQTRVSSLNFASNQMLGNIGAPLDGGSFNEEEEEEEEERVEMEAIGRQHDRSAGDCADPRA